MSRHPPQNGCLPVGANRLLDLGFAIQHVLAHHRIKFFHFQLVRSRPLILGRRVKVAGTRRRNELYLVSHFKAAS